jgi:hypothetical protein
MDVGVFPAMMLVIQGVDPRLGKQAEECSEDRQGGPSNNDLLMGVLMQNRHAKLAALHDEYVLFLPYETSQGNGWRRMACANDPWYQRRCCEGCLQRVVMRKSDRRAWSRGRDKEGDGGGGVVVEAASPSSSVP